MSNSDGGDGGKKKGRKNSWAALIELWRIIKDRTGGRVDGRVSNNPELIKTKSFALSFLLHLPAMVPFSP